MGTVTTYELKALVGSELGVSEWMTIDQSRIDAFADATNDHQFIHVDPERAAQTPFGSTIAHGYLTLSLVTPLVGESLPRLDGTAIVLNYGSNRVRYLEPVRVGSRIRARTELVDVADKGGGRWLLTTRARMEIEGSEKPALVADILTMYVVA